MPRNGSGTYTAPVNSANPAVPFTTISSTSHNAILTDLVAALTDSLSRSGNGGMLTALAMGGFKVTGMADGASATDAATIGQVSAGYQPLAAALTALAALATNGHIVRTGAATYAARTLTGSSGRVTITNGDGVSGNPTVDWDGVQVRKNSAGSTLTRRRLNLIEGTNITLTVADDAGDDEVDVTVAASGSSPGAVLYNAVQSLSAAEQLQARTNIGAQPYSQTAAGVGQVVDLLATAGNALVLPAGGTWSWWAWGYASPAATITAAVTGGIDAGGTTIRSATGGTIWTGRAKRIA